MKPSFSTHNLVDGRWTPKATHHQATQNPIGFRPQTPSATASVTMRDGIITVNGTRWYDRRKEALRAVEIAAGKALVAGRDPEVIAMIRRGRLGSKEDNLQALNWLVQRYQAAA